MEVAVTDLLGELFYAEMDDVVHMVLWREFEGRVVFNLLDIR